MAWRGATGDGSDVRAVASELIVAGRWILTYIRQHRCAGTGMGKRTRQSQHELVYVAAAEEG